MLEAAIEGPQALAKKDNAAALSTTRKVAALSTLRMDSSRM